MRRRWYLFRFKITMYIYYTYPLASTSVLLLWPRSTPSYGLWYFLDKNSCYSGVTSYNFTIWTEQSSGEPERGNHWRNLSNGFRIKRREVDVRESMYSFIVWHCLPWTERPSQSYWTIYILSEWIGNKFILLKDQVSDRCERCDSIAYPNWKTSLKFFSNIVWLDRMSELNSLLVYARY